MVIVSSLPSKRVINMWDIFTNDISKAINLVLAYYSYLKCLHLTFSKVSLASRHLKFYLKNHFLGINSPLSFPSLNSKPLGTNSVNRK